MERIIEMFKGLGFEYSSFWADAGDRDIFKDQNGVEIIFYSEEDNYGGHNYYCDGLIDMSVHEAITAYLKYKGWIE